ncbi:CBS domain-containing protein [Halorussus sp. MSC15.2]|uniref:CBS domain-containing protein n=1 Tax=Halorussus sp. MSC15.2 TaxID=2283638 RepID=UPI0013D84A68|nr:CBS domain-containing protein [Halorussus sp. MSC15.2]NEU55975.1 CBS domain-containing protein [Halorussus sp. MSC15.2]
MDIADIATTDFTELDAASNVGKARSVFEDENPKGIIVTKSGEYEGVITQKQLLRSHIEDHTKIETLTKSAPKVDRTDDVRDVARSLVEGGTKVAPVFESGSLWGVVSEDLILEAVLEHLDSLTVEQIYTENVITIAEDATLGQAINRLREHGISRLPVVDEDGFLTGVVTTHDVVEFATRNVQKTTRGDRSGEGDRLLDLPVYDVMSSPATTTQLDETVRAAVERMFENDYSGLVVTPEDDDRVVGGVITKTDVLRALSYTEEEVLDVQITNVNLLDTLSRESIRSSIEEITEKYGKMQVRHAHVRFHEHKERLRGTPLIQCKIRLRTNRGQVAGSGEGYGAEQAFNVARDKLERNVLEVKGVESDREYQGQLLRKLGEL